MKLKATFIVIIVIVALLFASAYTVDETEQVIITQFGRIVGEPKKDPGLKFKIPFIQNVNIFPKNLLEWDGDPGQIPTLEKTYIWVDTFARWKIVDPIKFFQTVNNTSSAVYKLNDIIDPAVRNYITQNKLIEAVRRSNRKFEIVSDETVEKLNQIEEIKYGISTGRVKITAGILKEAQPKLNTFGIELVDVKIKRINYVEQVRKTVYDRMVAERNQIAEKYRSEGQGEARKWLGKKERDLKEITSEAYRKAQEIKGKADAESTKLYAKAYGADPEFYSFIKTLEIYGTALDENSSLVLSTDSEFLKYLKGYSK
jgi:membrane protease subunit HflC